MDVRLAELQSRVIPFIGHALGALAIGAAAIGAVAVGALAVGRLAVGRAGIRRLEIDELVVRRLQITGEFEVPPNPAPRNQVPKQASDQDRAR
jgi:hypothetical protein